MAQFKQPSPWHRFGSQALYLIVVVALSIALGFNDVQTGQLGQGVDTLWSGSAFFIAWKTLKPAPAAHELPEGKSVFSQSFPQVWQTVKRINANYGQSLRWYLSAVVFAEAAVNAFTVVSVVFLADQLHMSGTQIGIFFRDYSRWYSTWEPNRRNDYSSSCPHSVLESLYALHNGRIHSWGHSS